MLLVKMTKKIFISQATLKLGRNRPQRILERKMDEEPDLRFVMEGTKEIIIIPELAKMCCYTKLCQQLKYVDTDCFEKKKKNCLEYKRLIRQGLPTGLDRFKNKYGEKWKN